MFTYLRTAFWVNIAMLEGYLNGRTDGKYKAWISRWKLKRDWRRDNPSTPEAEINASLDQIFNK